MPLEDKLPVSDAALAAQDRVVPAVLFLRKPFATANLMGEISPLPVVARLQRVAQTDPGIAKLPQG